MEPRITNHEFQTVEFGITQRETHNTDYKIWNDIIFHHHLNLNYQNTL